MERVEALIGRPWIAAYRLSPVHKFVVREGPRGEFWAVSGNHMWQSPAAEGYRDAVGPFDDAETAMATAVLLGFTDPAGDRRS